MRMLRSSLLAIGLAVLLVPTESKSQAPGYEGIPLGFDYPADRAQLEQFRSNQDLPALRKHSWMLFAGMTVEKSDGTPFWETWYRATEAFRPAGPTPQGPRRVIHQFETPNQFKHSGVQPQAPGESGISFVLFNFEGFNHIRTNGLFDASKLNDINASFPSGTAWNNRKVPDFPARAMTIKTVWWPVAGDGKTPIPIWDNDPARPLKDGNDFRFWKRVVVVDGQRTTVPDGEFMDARFLNKPFPHSHVVGVGSFYGFKADQATGDDIANNPDPGLRATIQQALGRPLRAGDFMVLVALHTTSKEIDDWTWQTFWWHDKPNEGPYAADRPDVVKGIWRNYLMANTDDQVTPREADGSPHIGFNPWLEARFPNGPLTNCMTCHHRASWRRGVPFIDPDHLEQQRGLPDSANDPAFAPGRLQTDFMWSIIDRAQ
jgi:hypothetical protein